MQKINDFLKDYYVDSGLYGSPVPIKEQLEGSITCCLCLDYGCAPVDYSVVMPVHNQEAIIRRNLGALVECMRGSYEIILILDSCNDNSKGAVLDYFRGLTGAAGLTRVVVIESDVPLFETVCDNIGFRLGAGKWLLEIQADMKMTEPGFNLRLTAPFVLYDNVIAVSGRCCHSLDQAEIIGRGGHAIERPVSDLGLDMNLFYVHEVCNRGPLLLDAAKAKAMGYLDEMNFFLDYSEIDMVLRAYDEKGWICGYVPIDFDAPLEDGSTRKKRDAVNEYILNVRRQRCGGGFVDVVRGRQQQRRKPKALALA
jgi:glycosyltransferase involved in cell wall biosynthesis